MGSLTTTALRAWVGLVSTAIGIIATAPAISTWPFPTLALEPAAALAQSPAEVTTSEPTAAQDSPAQDFPAPEDAAENSAVRPGHRPSTPVVIPTPRPVRSVREMIPPSTQPPSPGSITDPAEEVAPAVIELPTGDRPINPAVALAMQQELKNLMGRFESAILLTNALDMPTTLAVDSSDSLAGLSGPKAVASEPDRFLHPALAEAQQLLDEWEPLLTANRHTELKQRWLTAREALWRNLPTERPYAQSEIRAIWLDRGTIVQARSPEGLKQVFDRLAEAGINTVFFETVNAGYPIYPSQVAPEQNPLTRRWDPLASAVTLAHERGMTLHAWVWVFAAGNQRHNRLLNLPATYPGPILAQHPTWAGYDNAGNRIPPGQDKPFLDPAHPEVRSYLTRLMTEIVQNYEVDGIHLDYIRYPFQDPGANRTYGYGEVARWRFQSITGVDPLSLSARLDPSMSQNEQIQQRVLWDRWTEFRVQQVNSFVETLSGTLRRQRPDLVLSAAVFAHPEHERLQKIQQDWGTWARAGYLDWIVLMSYAQDTSRFERLVRPWLVDQTFGSTLVIPGIRLLSLANTAAIDQLQTARDLPTPGYALFATADLSRDLTTQLGQTQRSPQPTPQSSLQMALDRYHTLQREWHWLLSQERLWMEHSTLDPWVSAVNQLEADFKALADSPSRRELEQVKTGLVAVRTPLDHRVLVDIANSAYRLQVWQYRLTVIEQLLNQVEIR